LTGVALRVAALRPDLMGRMPDFKVKPFWSMERDVSSRKRNLYD